MSRKEKSIAISVSTGIILFVVGATLIRGPLGACVSFVGLMMTCFAFLADEIVKKVRDQFMRVSSLKTYQYKGFTLKEKEEDKWSLYYGYRDIELSKSEIKNLRALFDEVLKEGDDGRQESDPAKNQG